MKIMVGIDLHSNNALCALMEEDGKRMFHKKLPCDLAKIVECLHPHRKTLESNCVFDAYK